jgi:hypothetical protein
VLWGSTQFIPKDGIKTNTTTTTTTPATTSPAESGGVQFRHDPRLQWPSLQYWTIEQVEAVYYDIQCPTAVILAQSGWPFDPEQKQRTIELLQPVVCETLPGSHHFHADPDTADAVSDTVIKFVASGIEK